MAGKRSDREIVADWCRLRPDGRTTAQKISLGLIGEHQRWTEDYVNKVIDSADLDENFPLFRYKGSVQFVGNDGKGLYKAVVRVGAAFFESNHGLRDVLMVDTSHSGTKGSGAWVHPDLVMRAFPRRRAAADSPYDLHSIEVEHGGGFDMRSVYQAFEQGRGADYSWVVFNIGATSSVALERMTRVANETGVGLVQFSKPTVRSSWRTLVVARRQPFNYFAGKTEKLDASSMEERREEFLRIAVGAENRGLLLGEPEATHPL
jgi:hypothetical protein